MYIPDALKEIERLEQEIQQEGRFVADVSHELRSPLAGLRAKLEEAQLHPDDTTLCDLLDWVLGDIDRLDAIVTDLLILARVNRDGHRAVLQQLDLAELVHAEISRRADRLEYRLQLAPRVKVRANRTQIGRVLTNLLNNAQRHGRRTVEIEVRRDGDCAELIVADDGPGIAEGDREKIFDRFTRLPLGRELDSQGAGLGLTISREIAHAHSGTLQVSESAAGGARFAFRLPLTRP